MCKKYPISGKESLFDRKVKIVRVKLSNIKTNQTMARTN